MKLTLTYDQGKEMAAHRLFTFLKETNMQACFAHPRSPWERGANVECQRLDQAVFSERHRL